MIKYSQVALNNKNTMSLGRRVQICQLFYGNLTFNRFLGFSSKYPKNYEFEISGSAKNLDGCGAPVLYRLYRLGDWEPLNTAIKHVGKFWSERRCADGV